MTRAWLLSLGISLALTLAIELAAARIACELSGAGRMPSTLANVSAASKTDVCSTLMARIMP